MAPSPPHRSDPVIKIHNPHFDGSEFYWEAGSSGILLIHVNIDEELESIAEISLAFIQKILS